MAKRNGKYADNVLDLPVEFGGVSIGETTARLGMKIKKEVLNIIQAEEAFCGRRLSGVIKLGGAADSPGQTTMFDTELVVDGTFDIHRFGVGPEAYTTGATFKLKEIDIGDLARFSKGAGRLVVANIAAIPTDEVLEDDDEDTSGELPGTLKSEGPWRDFSLDELFSGAVLKSLKKAGLQNVGDLADYTAGESRLTDIAGIGEGKAQQIEDRMLAFWRDNPQEAGA